MDIKIKYIDVIVKFYFFKVFEKSLWKYILIFYGVEGWEGGLIR